MKKILILIIITLSVLSCSKEFVIKYPTTSTVIETYYKTPDDATQAITSIYNMALFDDYWGSFLLSEIASDECAGGGGVTDGGGYQEYDRGIPQNNGDANQLLWKTYYGGIYRANVYIQNESKINWKGQEQLEKQYLAEARFLRGYYHFYMARMFGEIPFLDHVLLPTEIPGRTPAAELYGDILDDLNYCIQNGLSAAYPGDMNNLGRATKWAAEAMFARVYLYYSGYYNSPTVKSYSANDALNNINDIISNGGFSLVPKYASLWIVPTLSVLGDSAQYAGSPRAAGLGAGDTIIKNGSTQLIVQNVNVKKPISEVVWSISGVSGGGNNVAGSMIWERIIGPRNTNSYPYGQGWGGMPVLKSLWDSYDSLDTRRTATILNWAREKKIYNWQANGQAQYTGFNTKKYDIASNLKGVPTDAADWQNNGDESYQVIRYADVLLMQAELLITTGGSNATATSDVNQVRERAYGNNLHDLPSVTIDDIMKERKLELACEGIRYWDILRSCKGDFSKLAGILTYTDNNDGDVDYSASTTNTLSLDVDGNNFVAKKGLFQIPVSEISLMKGKISQNPGY